MWGPLKGTAWDSSSFCLPQPQFPLVFTARSYGELTSWHWNPGLCNPGLGLGLIIPKVFFPIFIHHMWVRNQPILHLHPSNHGFFFNSIVVGFPFSSISDGSEWWLFYSLVVILIWLCEEASHVCLRHHLDWKFRMSFLEPNFFFIC